MRWWVPTILLGALALLAINGCGRSREPSGAVPARLAGPTRHDDHEHAHAKGVVTIGDHHAKLLVEQGGVLKLFILGKDETKVATIEVQEIQGLLQADQSVAQQAEAVAVTLKADPQPGDPAGRTSQFKGETPEALRGKPFVATFLLTVNGERYRPQFSSVVGTGHDDHAGRPKGVERGSARERELYLTPGGLYTAADIQANGGVLPSVKFKDIAWPHDDDLKPGDRVCPVTNQKADLRCSWVVAGKSYAFCCPPCLDKFVGWAKTKPEKIKDPAEYVEK